MTWGSHCGRCGREDCAWEKNGTCDGEQRDLAHRKAGPSAEVVAAIEGRTSDETEVDKLRNRVRQQRDIKVEIRELEERTKEKKVRLFNLERVELPDFFQAAKTDHLGLPAEGNLPAYDAKLKPYYKAVVAASWPIERRESAYNYLIKTGQGHMIKSVVKLSFGRGEGKNLAILKKLLDDNNFDYSEDLDVPWSTLTAYVKETVEDHKKKHTEAPLAEFRDLLGADIGYVVELKERKS